LLFATALATALLPARAALLALLRLAASTLGATALLAARAALLALLAAVMAVRAGFACLAGVELVGVAARVRSASAFCGDLALAFGVHAGEAATAALLALRAAALGLLARAFVAVVAAAIAALSVCHVENSLRLKNVRIVSGDVLPG
jgi:hypothetical protein